MRKNDFRGYRDNIGVSKVFFFFLDYNSIFSKVGEMIVFLNKKWML